MLHTLKPRSWRDGGPGWRARGWGALLCLAVGMFCAAAPAPRALIKNSLHGHPNFLVVLAESLDFGDLTCYGGTNARLANLDQLGKQGLRFSQAYAASAEAAPAQAAWLSGRHSAPEPPAGTAAAVLSAPAPSLVPALRQSGYLAGALGWWPLGAEHHPLQRGFEEWLGFFALSEAQQVYPQFMERNERRHEFNPPGNPRRAAAPDLLMTAATNFIRTTHLYPFLLQIGYAPPATNQHRGEWLERLDRDLGHLLAALRQHRLETQTVVLVTSLRAATPAERAAAGVPPGIARLRRSDAGLYEGDLRVPLLVCWPGRVPPGTNQSQPVATWDLWPAMLTLAQAKPPNAVDGTASVSTWLGEPQTNQTAVLYWANPRAGGQAVRQGPWKLVRPAARAPLELYHLVNDPREQQDLAGQQSGLVQRLSGLLENPRRPHLPPP